jgi:DnaJ-class molecular chaperone
MHAVSAPLVCPAALSTPGHQIFGGGGFGGGGFGGGGGGGGGGGDPFGFGGGMGGMGGGPFGGMGGMPFGGMGGMGGGPFGGMGGMPRRPAGPQKDPTIEVKLACSLEELYNGTTKKMKINRKVGGRGVRPGRALAELGQQRGRPAPPAPDPAAAAAMHACARAAAAAAAAALTRALPGPQTSAGRAEELLEIHVRPGWKRGTKITFPEKGERRAPSRAGRRAGARGTRPRGRQPARTPRVRPGAR